MKKITTTLFTCLFLYSISFSQEIKNLFPDSISELNLSKKGEQAYNTDMEIYDGLLSRYDADEEKMKMTPKEKEIWESHNEVMGSYWDIEDGGCSWYCGGGPKEVTASSTLSPGKTINYDGENAHDLNYKTAWAEGIKGDGIGEYLTYHFEAQSPRITKIIVANGYVKSEKAWRENSRVKKIKIYINDRPFAILNLEDKRAEQSFEVAPIGKFSKTEGWTLKFEIMEAYPGEKYDDVVISEIYFDGIDVHCFAKGSKVTMADHSHMNIENLEIGQNILTFNPQTQDFEPAEILELAAPVHSEMVSLAFDDGTEIVSTPDHPYLASDGHWTSCDPDKTGAYYTYEKVSILAPGQFISVFDIETQKLESRKLISIQKISMPQKTYTIVKTNKNNAFIVNGVIVGTETLREGL